MVATAWPWAYLPKVMNSCLNPVNFGYNYGTCTFFGADMTKTTLILGIAMALAGGPCFAKGDAQNGKSLAYTCTGCHGIPEYKNAYPSYHVPKIAGQNEAYIVIALTAYAKGDRKHPTMSAQARSFSSQEIADIAAYLSAIKPAKK